MCSTPSSIQTTAVPVKAGEKKCSGNCNDCRKKKKDKSLIKTIGILAMMLFVASPLLAQDSVQPSYWNDPFNHPMTPLYIITTFIFVVIILIGFVGLYLIKVVNLLTVQAEKDRAAKLGMEYVPRPTWWSKFMQQVNASVPVEEEQSIELDHEYDGIKELDNHLPPWWKWLFIGTIIWGAIYLVVYHIWDSMPLQIQEYETELVQAKEQLAKLRASQPQAVIDVNTLEYSADAEILGNGKTIYTTNCVACHNSDGGGNAIGPNLTDDYWLHMGDLKSIFNTINVGVVEKGMPAWGKTMSPKDVRDVTFYVMSLHGTTPANPKAPQGELYKPEPKAAPADSTTVQASL